MKQKVLFVCTNNSAKSQIAEGFLNTFYKNNYEAFSAGTRQSPLNPYAVEVMKEVGIDISQQLSKSIKEFRNKKFCFVITICDNAIETCPFFPGKIIIHKSIKNPTTCNGNIEEILKCYRRLRNQIKDFIKKKI